MYTVEQLRQKGCRVRVHHNRLIDTRDFSIFPRGGNTMVEITLPDGTELTGTSKCSDKDNYDKKIARTICIGRAMAGINL